MAQALTPKMIEAIELRVANPKFTDVEICKRIGVTSTTMSRWKKKQEYWDELHKACREKFKAAETIAIEGLIKNAENGNVQAQKYLLDYMDYKAPDKVEQTVTVIDVTVDDE